MKRYGDLAKKIKLARTRAGYSQQELAEILKLSDKAISSYEVGRATPTVYTLGEIADCTNTTMSYFLEEEGSTSNISHKIEKIEGELSEIKKLLQKRAQSE